MKIYRYQVQLKALIVFRSVQKELNKKPPVRKSGKTGAAYAAVVEVESPKDAVEVASEEEEEGKEKAQNFLERMRRRDQREVKRGILHGGEPRPKTYSAASTSRRKKKPAAPARAEAGPNPIEELSCSKDMKDFMRAEYDREKEKYKDVPKNQIANSIIHRYRTHQANSGKSKDVPSLKSKEGSMKRRASGRKKPLSSVEIGSGQESDEDEISIQEFDEAEFQPPAEGSFSLSPSPRQLRSRRNLLVRFTKDEESIPIANGPGQILRRYTLGNEGNEVLEGGEKRKAASKTGQKSKRKSPRREKKPVIEVEPRKTPAKRRKLDESLSSPVTASSDSKAVTTSQGDAKTKKTVTINSQPEFFSSSEPADEFCPEEEEGVVVPLKSILKKSPLPEEVAPPTPSSQRSLTEEDGKLSQPASQERHRPVKVKLLDKFNKVSPLSDENFANLMRDMEKIHNSPNISLEEEDGTKDEKKFLEDLVNAKSCGSCGGGGGDGGTGELSQCGRCMTVAYCDQQCQKTAWAKHKLVCDDLAKLREKEKEDGKSRKQEKKDLIQSVLSPGASNTRPKTNPEKTPSPSTPETSPTLAQSIRTQSIKRSHRKRHLPVLGRRTKDKIYDVKGKIDFAAFLINDEVVEEAEFLKFSSSSLETSADGSSPPTNQGEEKSDPPSSFEILDEFGPQKVSWLPPLC